MRAGLALLALAALVAPSAAAASDYSAAKAKSSSLPKYDNETVMCMAMPICNAAMEDQHEELAKLVAAADAIDPQHKNLKDRFGFTPLHWSAHLGHVKATKVLLDAGADTALKTGDGYTIYDVCLGKEVRELIGEAETARTGKYPVQHALSPIGSGGAKGNQAYDASLSLDDILAAEKKAEAKAKAEKEAKAFGSKMKDEM